jgi:hypothetical protein
MHLVEVDVVDAEAAKAVVQGGDHPAPGGALMVAFLAHRRVELRRQHDVVAAAGDGPSHHLLRLAVAVAVGGVNQVDAGLEGAVDDRGRLLLGRLADGTEVHRAERETADRDAGASECAVFHVFLRCGAGACHTG